jgi:hypothetical protein
MPLRPSAGSLADNDLCYFTQPGSNTSFFFMSVHAITSIFYRKFDSHFGPDPFYFCLPSRLEEKYFMKKGFLAGVTRAAW